MQAPIDERFARDVQLAGILRPEPEDFAASVDVEHEIGDSLEKGLPVGAPLTGLFLDMLEPAGVFPTHLYIWYR